LTQYRRGHKGVLETDGQIKVVMVFRYASTCPDYLTNLSHPLSNVNTNDKIAIIQTTVLTNLNKKLLAAGVRSGSALRIDEPIWPIITAK